jgi:autotransporter-associated beta strand protein
MTATTVRAGSSLLTVDTGASPDSTITGRIEGTGGLRKLGAGTLTLAGMSVFTGATTIDRGTLVVNGSIGADGLPPSAKLATARRSCRGCSTSSRPNKANFNGLVPAWPGSAGDVASPNSSSSSMSLPVHCRGRGLMDGMEDDLRIGKGTVWPSPGTHFSRKPHPLRKYYATLDVSGRQSNWFV